MKVGSWSCRLSAALTAIALLVLHVLPVTGAERVIAREGRAISIRFPSEVRLKEMPRDGIIQAEIADPVLASGKTILSPGGRVLLTVSDFRKPGRFRGGRITISGGRTLAVDGSEILLRPEFTRSGGRRIPLSVLLLPFTLIGLVNGSPARIKAGEIVALEVARDSEVLVD